MIEAGLDAVQWPAMAVTLIAAWLVASPAKRRRGWGFWCFILSNGLWALWGWHSEAYALIALQVGLLLLNVRGARNNDPEAAEDFVSVGVHSTTKRASARNAAPFGSTVGVLHHSRRCESSQSRRTTNEDTMNQPTEQNANKDAVKNANPAQQQSGRQNPKPRVSSDESGDDAMPAQKAGESDEGNEGSDQAQQNQQQSKPGTGASKH